MCNESKKTLKDSFALDYIKWGETDSEWVDQKTRRLNPPYKRPTCKSRKYWWGTQSLNSEIVYPSTHNPTWFVFYNNQRFYMDKVFYGIKFEKPVEMVAFLNSYLFLLEAEISGYNLVGGGGSFITVVDLSHLLVFKKNILKQIYPVIKNYNLLNKKIRTIFEELGFDKDKPIRSQEPNPLPDRAALDKIVFDVLDLTEKERKEVYWSVAELVKNRLDKAKSLKKK